MIGIQGIEKIIFSEIPEICTIVINGGTGVLKTTFVIECARAILNSNENKVCLFFCFKDEVNLLVKRMNLQNYVEKGNLIIIDYDFIQENMPNEIFQYNIFKGVSSILTNFKEKYGDRLSFIALDPINILINQVPEENLRRYLYHFFTCIADLKTRSWIILEKIDEEPDIESAIPCHFLSDSIIELGMQETHNDVIRYMEVKKMRSVNHSLKRFQISYKKNSLKVLGPVYE